jgi:hypothetical protein
VSVLEESGDSSISFFMLCDCPLAQYAFVVYMMTYWRRRKFRQRPENRKAAKRRLSHESRLPSSKVQNFSDVTPGTKAGFEQVSFAHNIHSWPPYESYADE